MNTLLVFVPLGIVAQMLDWPAVWRFSLNFLAIVPLAKVSLHGLFIAAASLTLVPMQLLGDCTEQASLKLGQTLGGLLNAT